MNISKKCVFLWITIFLVINISDSVLAEEDDDIDLTFPDCGKTGGTGGGDVQEHSWPWVAALFVSDSGNLHFFCGGTLISRQYILTAAHCTLISSEYKIEPSQLVVYLGSNFRDDGEQYGVSSIERYPDYNRFSLDNDIAVIKLDKEVEFSSKVFPVCLPSKGGLGDRVDEEGEVTVTGWGVTGPYGESSDMLQEAHVKIFNQEECAEDHKKLRRSITTNNICATHESKDTCKADSGGPMVKKIKDADTYAQIGIVSFGGVECGKPEIPGVYTRVSQYTKWLRDNTDLGSQ